MRTDYSPWKPWRFLPFVHQRLYTARLSSGAPYDTFSEFRLGSPFEPRGYTLLRLDGQRHNRIRGDLIPRGMVVINEDGRSFVRTGRKDREGFLVYAEGHDTYHYEGWD